MNILIGIIGLIFAILQIILFFKLWGMTNDVRSIRDKLMTTEADVKPVIKENDSPFEIGDWVISPTGKEVEIVEIEDGKYHCYTNRRLFYEGSFDASELTHTKV